MPNKKKTSKSDNTGINTAIEQIKSKFGDTAIMKLGDSASQINVEIVPTGIISLDIALGAGGLPRGRIVEIYGAESSGKTTVANYFIAQVQKQGGTAAFVDAEHALDPDYAKKIGVSIDDLLISQPDSGEQALEIVETLVRSNAVDIIVVDSVAALTPRAEIEGEMGDSHMALQARLMSQALRKLTAIASKSKTIIIFINQVRQKIGVFFGNPETTTGGMALKFYSSVRMELRKSAQLKKGDKIVGNRVKVKIVKNKIAPPFKIAEFDLMFDEPGIISKPADVLDTGIELGIITKSGNTLSWNDQKLGVGRENAKKFLYENKKVMDKIISEIWKQVKSKK